MTFTQKEEEKGLSGSGRIYDVSKKNVELWTHLKSLWNNYRKQLLPFDGTQHTNYYHFIFILNKKKL